MTTRHSKHSNVPRRVTLIGQNNQLVSLTQLFCRADIEVEVYTADERIYEHLTLFKGVTMHAISPQYTSRPVDLPPPPYFLCLDNPALAQRVKEWLPPTQAMFLVRSVSRLSKDTSGLLRLSEPDSQVRSNLLKRLSNLTRVDRLMEMARSAKKPLIVMYGEPDPDAIGAALGLAHLWRLAGASVGFRSMREVSRYQNRLLTQYTKEPIRLIDSEELAESDLVALVDAQPSFWKSNPPKFDVVIDHHPLRDACDASFVDIRPEYGSTSTILTEYLTDAGIGIPRKIATSLLYGLITDTGDLSRNTGRADIEAYQDVHAKADHHFISRLQKSVIPRPILDGLAWGIQHRVVVGEAMVVHYGPIETPDLLVQTADFLLLTLGIWWVAIAGISEGKLIIVFRGDGHRQDVGTRARAAFGRKGSAGGHRTMGRAEIPLTDETTDETISILVEGLFRRFKPKRRQSLIRQFRDHLKTPFIPSGRGISNTNESNHA